MRETDNLIEYDTLMFSVCSMLLLLLKIYPLNQKHLINDSLSDT